MYTRMFKNTWSSKDQQKWTTIKVQGKSNCRAEAWEYIQEKLVMVEQVEDPKTFNKVVKVGKEGAHTWGWKERIPPPPPNRHPSVLSNTSPR